MTEDEFVARLVRLAGRRKPVPAARSARARAVVHAEWKEATRSRGRRRSGARLAWSLAAAAAVVAVLVLVGWRAEIGPFAPTPPVGLVEIADGSTRLVPRTEIVAGTLIDTGRSGRVAIRLSSGHSIRLDRDTRLRVRSASRLVLEAGAVYADSGVDRGTKASIEVVTPIGSIRDVGTQFEVRVVEDSTRVRVREGAVEVEHPGGVEIARAGFEIEVDDAGVVRRGEVPIVGPDWEWAASIAPPFDLDGATLTEFLAWVSRETGLRVVYQDAATAEAAPGISLSGDVVGLSPREALSAVLPTCGLSHRVEGGDVYLSPGS